MSTLGQLGQSSCAISKLMDVRADPIEERHKEIVKRSFTFELDVPSRLYRISATSGQDDGEFGMMVRISVG